MKGIELTKSFQASRKSLSHGILLGMQCSKPKLVPIPLHDSREHETDFTVWASMPKEIMTMNTIIKAIDDVAITIVYEKQRNAPEVYKNCLLSDSRLLWKGNVILLREEGRWRSNLFEEFSWMEEVKMVLLRR